MAAGWLSLLQKLPWSEVLVNAPAVAQGARKLWGTVAGKVADPAPEVPPATQADAPAADPAFASRVDLDAAIVRIDAAEAAVADLRRQLLVSSELLSQLAQQNAQLIEQVQALGLRLRWMAAGLVGIAITAIAALVLTLSR